MANSATFNNSESRVAESVIINHRLMDDRSQPATYEPIPRDRYTLKSSPRYADEYSDLTLNHLIVSDQNIISFIYIKFISFVRKYCVFTS